MDENKREQIESLEVLDKFNSRLVSNMKILAGELSGSRLEDTDKLQKSVIDAMNWEIQIVNATMDVLNDGEERVNKDSFNKAISALAGALAANDDAEIALQLEAAATEFENLGDAVKKTIAANQ